MAKNNNYKPISEFIELHNSYKISLTQHEENTEYWVEVNDPNGAVEEIEDFDDRIMAEIIYGQMIAKYAQL